MNLGWCSTNVYTTLRYLRGARARVLGLELTNVSLLLMVVVAVAS